MLTFRKDGDLYTLPRAEFLTTGPLILGIDSSKTNSCMMIADECGNDLCYFELRGEPEDDVLYQCQEQRKWLRIVFNGAKIRFCGIEDIVSKKDSKTHHVGMDEHETRYKITSIFVNFIVFFQDQFNVTPELINNWLWKVNVLPEKYRTKEYGKGSLAWHKDRRTKYMNCKDDVTDAHCIKEYLLIIHDVKQAIRVSNEPEIKKFKAFVQLISPRNAIASEKQFIYNDSMSLEANVIFIVNRVDPGKYATCTISIKSLTIEQVYTMCKGSFLRKESVLTLAVGNGGRIVNV